MIFLCLRLCFCKYHCPPQETNSKHCSCQCHGEGIKFSRVAYPTGSYGAVEFEASNKKGTPLLHQYINRSQRWTAE